jgi:Protein of unknown function TPD sequence-motif
MILTSVLRIVTRREVQGRLAKEVRQAINFDPFYGPLHDKERHTVGIEYEVILEQELKALGTQYSGTLCGITI